MGHDIIINDTRHTVDLPDEVPLLWVLRDVLNLTGTKFGCGIGACGACSVLIDGEAVRSCQVAIADVWGRVTTIEGIGAAENLAPVQAAWIAHQVAQCGYCQSGQIIQATALLNAVADPTDEQIDAAMSGNICRCGTYPRIRAAIHDAATRLNAREPNP